MPSDVFAEGRGGDNIEKSARLELTRVLDELGDICRRLTIMSSNKSDHPLAVLDSEGETHHHGCVENLGMSQGLSNPRLAVRGRGNLARRNACRCRRYLPVE